MAGTASLTAEAGSVAMAPAADRMRAPGSSRTWPDAAESVRGGAGRHRSGPREEGSARFPRGAAYRSHYFFSHRNMFEPFSEAGGTGAGGLPWSETSVASHAPVRRE